MVKTLVASVALCLSAFSATADDNADPYLWLENIDSERALEWVKQQNADTAKDLKAVPEFDQFLADAKAALNNESRVPGVYQQGDYLYNYWRDDAHPRGLFRRTSLESFRSESPEWEVVLDMDAMSEKDGVQWVFKGMNCLPDAYTKCLVSLSPGGGDAVEVREFDAATKTFVEDGFFSPKAKQAISWIDADTLFIASDFGEGSLTDSGYPRTVRIWKRGSELADAQEIYAGQQGSVFISASRMRSDGGDVDLVNESTSFWTNKSAQWIDGQLKPLNLPETAVISGLFDGRLLISLKEDWQMDDQTFPQGAVVIADTAKLRGEDGDIDLLIAPSETTVIQSVATSGKAILVSMLDDVQGRLVRMTRDGDAWNSNNIEFPANGAINLVSTNDKDGSFFVDYQSFTIPPTLYYVDGPCWTAEAVKAQEATFDGDAFKVEQHFTQSADGTRVPYFAVLPKDMDYDGTNPVHIFSYGGFRNALTPSYSGSYENLYGAYGKLWLERGGVFVLANIRGGGEYGPAWHAAALKEDRPRAFEDFEAIVDDLIERKVTSAEHIGIEGRSNGGLLVGALITRKPHQYGAAIIGVPLLDMQRYHKLLAGASWMAEFGDPDKPEEWEYIKRYSPYHNLKPGVDYPATFFYTSTRDDRVHPGHARKMAARMQSLGQQIWYYENLEGGHGGSSTNDQLAYRLALAYAHLWKQLR